VVRKIFRPKRYELTGGRRKLQNEELHNLYSSPSIIRMIKPRRMAGVGHVAHTRGKRNGKIFWWESHSRKTVIHGHEFRGARNQK
jgi:hypothetical protein